MHAAVLEEKKTKTVLLVNNEPEDVRIRREMLADLGYGVITQPDSETALSMLHQGAEIDLVIIDYRAPGMNGQEFITSLRRLMPSVPVIMITADKNIEIYLHSFSLGGFKYADKQIKKDEFDWLVKLALNGVERRRTFHDIRRELYEQHSSHR